MSTVAQTAELGRFKAGPAILEGLGGRHWGLLPTLLSLPWLVSLSQGGADPAAWRQGWFVLLGGLMASYDLFERRIPNRLTALTALLGLTLAVMGRGPSGALGGLLGGLAGLGLMSLFFFLGAVGAGDVKGLAALATFLSPGGALALFILTALTGGALALAWLLAHHAHRLATGQGLGPALGLPFLSPFKVTMPYGLAIWSGAIALASLGGLQ